MDLVSTFWHCQCVSALSMKSFSAKYLKWCRKHGYYFSQEKAMELYSKAQGCIGVMPQNETTRFLIQQAIAQLRRLACTWPTAYSGNWRCSPLPFQDSTDCLCRVLTLLFASRDKWIFTAKASPNVVSLHCAGQDYSVDEC